MICPRCNNQDYKCFYKTKKGIYCRKCIMFQRTFVDQLIDIKECQKTTTAKYSLDYSLTPKQKKVSRQLVANYKNCKDSNVKAVCGAGKTEIVYEVIQYALNNKQRVCFSTPRKELTIELYNRISTQFTGVSTSLVYGGHTNDISGQLVICTTHQLHRFYKVFDLLIIDETDAYPYHGNEVLCEVANRAMIRSCIYMSATMDSENPILLTKRYHGHALPLPVIKVIPDTVAIVVSIYQVKQFIRKQKPVCVYVASKKYAKKLSRYYSMANVRHRIVYAGLGNIQESFELLKEKKIDVLICTTILERGITIENVQVLIMQGQSKIYDASTLVQISGRVGRKVNYPSGYICIYTVYVTKEIKECIASIQKDNA